MRNRHRELFERMLREIKDMEAQIVESEKELEETVSKLNEKEKDLNEISVELNAKEASLREATQELHVRGLKLDDDNLSPEELIDEMEATDRAISRIRNIKQEFILSKERLEKTTEGFTQIKTLLKNRIDFFKDMKKKFNEIKFKLKNLSLFIFFSETIDFLFF